ncbi:LppP/LprE family lipoprotein [Alicyclobacillus sp. ALC3]|uniref:LppP/LprE family lipoprotein n=1 Tax=Alicyclobacillus sp. ALC3 TaxID=2796143 RepID=UPI002378322E|nr:LppP/LprE family lipoprotein [Alicyclobacillus sp. ALC3]WDL95920.1 LppP/LprE family lipoprotein [Alicyclobacillus sp. ALC3]
MNKRFAFVPITGLVLLTLAGCGTIPKALGATHHQVANPIVNTSGAGTASKRTLGNSTVSTSATSTSAINAGSTSYTSTSGAKTTASTLKSTPTVSNSSAYANEIALIKGKGYDVVATKPNASVQTGSGDTLTAWIGVAMRSDGHNQYVFFFLNGKYLGTDTSKPSLEITGAQASGNGIAVTYPVYKANDSFANPTGTPVTITYTWNGSQLVPNKPYPVQFNTPSQSANYAHEIAVIESKGYSVTTQQPNASVKTANGETLSAWICILSSSQDGHNQRVLFFVNGQYAGADAQASLEITGARAAGTGAIAVTYPVYKANDSFANPTGTPVTITYTWNGSKLVPNKPYPKQFS